MDTSSAIDIHFPVLHQYWMDSGLLGFYFLAKDIYRSHPGIEFLPDETGVHLRGSRTDLEIFLREVYKVLLRDYYNTSTPKQKEELAGFYYDTKKDTFDRFPKVKAHGIAELIFSKAPRPKLDSVPYVKGRRKNQLPEPYTGLQERLDAFLSDNNLKADGATFLIDGRNEIWPKVEYKKGQKKACCLCGETHTTCEISGTVFPLITGSSGIKSFVSGCKDVDKVCWMCSYVAKFVPVLGHYSTSTNGESTYIFLMHSQSFQKMINVAPSLRSLTKYDENFFRNYEETLGRDFSHPFEQFFSFLYTVYLRTLAFSRKDSGYEEDRSLESLYGIFIDRSPVSFYLLHVQKLGQSFIGKLVWNFTESVYLFRLLQSLSKPEEKIDIKEVMRVLEDSDQPKQESKTLVRNKICERILKKQRIIDLVESFVYHVCRSETKFIKPAYDFMIAYEQILAGDDTMKRELIYTAVSLGKTLGFTLGTEGRKARGDLFRLRKARRPADFLNEVNRLQMKYSVSVTADLYNSGEEFDKNFSEFKQFCMVAALNSFNAKISEKKTSGE